MPVHNADIAAVFDEIAEPLKIQGASPFRIRAYRNAARTLDELPPGKKSFWMSVTSNTSPGCSCQRSGLEDFTSAFMSMR